MKINWYICKELLRAFSIFPIKQNKIIFSSYHGEKYACNPKYISESLQKYKKYEIIWIGPKDLKVPSGVKVIQKRSLPFFFHYATAKVWVDNTRKPIWMRKRKGQFYIQTWHAGISNKKGEAFAEDKLSKDYVISAKNDSNMADLFLSDSKWLTSSYHESFWYNGKVLENGLPREDKLYLNHNNFHQRLCRLYKSGENTKFVLYAPTFRNDGDLSCYDIDYERLLNTLQECTGDRWKIIIRLHPNIQSEQSLITYNNTVLNGSSIDEIDDLILGSNLFISDYSSCMFDAAIANIPVLLYASDVQQYETNERGFAFDWNDLPFKLATDNEQLNYNIRKFDRDGYITRVHSFFKKCGFVVNQHASDDVASYIDKICS